MPSTKPLILVVEDEPALVTMLRYNLEADGFSVISAEDGEEGRVMIDERSPDLIVLDWMLPKLSGIELCRQVRRDKETRHIPVVMLTARGEEDDRIRGLEAGADDYVIKPFSPRELIARVRAVLRRTDPSTSEDTLSYAGIRMDLVSHRVRRDGEEIKLGPTEFRLLQHFLKNPGRVYSRERLLDAVWGRDLHVEPRTVDVHIRRLRKALNFGDRSDLIRTVRSAGYSLDAE